MESFLPNCGDSFPCCNLVLMKVHGKRASIKRLVLVQLSIESVIKKK